MIRRKRIVLIDCFPSWQYSGIFSRMTWAPWYADFDKSVLDIEYFGNHSGLKVPSVLVHKYMNQNGVVLSEENIGHLSDIIAAKYRDNFEKLWAAITTTYAPLENYDLTETTTPGIVETINHAEKTVDLTKPELSDKTVHAEDRKTSHNIKTDGTAASSVVPFADGATAADVTGGKTGMTALAADNYDKVDSNPANNYDELKRTGQETNTRTRAELENFEKKTRVGTDTLKRHGNIGITSAQQMLEQEYNIRLKNYFDYVFDCVDNVLTAPFWDI